MNTSSIVQKLWNYCNVLRDDGMSYGDYPEVIRRRFHAELRNFIQVYKPLVDEWVLYDNSGDEPVRLEEGHKS